MNKDFLYMQRCLALAALAHGSAAPNPMVGSVVVHNDEIIGEGYHRKCGEAHAEVNALASVKDESFLKESTLYVNLEPCSHWGKTPPCANLIVEKQIKRVVVGCVDSFSEVSGKGIEHMRKHGVEVEVGVLEKESRELNKRFFTFHERKRPYIILKWAETRDGFIDIADYLKAEGSEGVWITNDMSRMLVHKWRTQEQGILVGTTTARKDNPRLNVRDWVGKNPVRFVLDRRGRLSENLHLFDGNTPTYIFTEQAKVDNPNVSYKKIDFSKLWESVCDEMYKLNIQSVIVEGGAVVLNSLLEKGLWDEARVFTGNCFFKEGVAAPKLTVPFYKQEDIDGVDLAWYRNTDE